MVAGTKARRGPQKRADYLLQYTRDFTIAVVEAKAAYKTPGTGLQQAKDYAEILGLKFAYATNGKGIVEFDYLTGLERELDSFPTPEELWNRLRRQAVEEADALSKSELATVFATLDRQVGSQQLGHLISDANYGTSIKCRYERSDDSVPVLRIPNVAGEHVNLSDIKFGVLNETRSSQLSPCHHEGGDVTRGPYKR